MTLSVPTLRAPDLAADELVRHTDAIGPDLDAVFADRDGVAGDALVIVAVAAGFLVILDVLDVGAGLQRLAVGGYREFHGPGCKVHASFGGFAVADGTAFHQSFRDLKSVVSRKGVYERVDLGGNRYN